MKLEKASRKKAKIRLGLSSVSGGGKTYSSILIAKGLCGDLTKVAIIDTENRSADLYAHLGDFQVIPLGPPFTPERYIQVLSTCEEAGMEVIIVDSASHEWQYLVDYHSTLVGNSWSNWAKVTPRHDEFIQKLLQSPAHIIITTRAKQDYVLNEKNGKMVPEKVGLKAIQRDTLEYELTISLDLDIKHYAVASKDRTGLFMDKPAFVPNEDTGKLVRDWCIQGDDQKVISTRINECASVKDLLDLYRSIEGLDNTTLQAFSRRRNELETGSNETFSLNIKNQTNGSQKQ